MKPAEPETGPALRKPAEEVYDAKTGLSIYTDPPSGVTILKSDLPFALALNGAVRADAPYGPAQADVLNMDAFETARRTICGWEGYAPTPLVSLPALARIAGIGALHYKDESGRFGLGSFKALGGAYAVASLLAREVARTTGDDTVTIDSLRAGDHREAVSAITVCCATGGNHGRSVAWGAQMFGCRCVIFLHATVSAGRERAIAQFGADIVRSKGNYDDSVREAQDTAQREGWFVVSDTSYEGYMDIPKDVMQGYTVMAAEAIGELPYEGPPTHLFLQTGAGGMAAAVAAQFWQVYGAARPTVVLADPANAECWYETLKSGQPTTVEGDLDTMMAGLACGEISLLAWKILEPVAEAAVVIDDEAAAEAMRMLADRRFADPPVVAGESAVAGLAALLAVAADDDARQKLRLGPDSRVLLFGTEGDTDPEIYRNIVGRSARDVLAVEAKPVA